MPENADREELARVLSEAVGGWVRADQTNTQADAIIAAGYRKPRTISAVEELDELPQGSVVLSSTVFLRCLSFNGHLVWGCVGSKRIYTAEEILELEEVATVLHEPTL